MAKMTQYFDSVEELTAYYPNGVGNQVLAFVKDGSGNYVLYTSTNDPAVTGSDSGSGDPVGGYVTSPEDEARIDDLEETKADKADVYTKSEVDEMIEDIDVDLTGYATESYVVSKIEDVVGAAPAALDTLKEIGDSLNNDADFAGTMTAALAAKANANDVYTKTAMDTILGGYATQSYVADYVSTYGGGEDNVQADWNVSDSTSDAYIKNKPDISQVTSGNSTYVSIGESLNEHIYPASANRWNIGTEGSAFNTIYANGFFHVGVGDLNRKIDGIFKQEATGSVSNTYTGQVVDYVSYLDLPTKAYVDDRTTFTDPGGNTWGVIDALADSDILTPNGRNYAINNVSDIYWENDDQYLENGYNADNPVEDDSPNNSLYSALEYAGVFEYIEGEDGGETYTYTWVNKLATQSYVADYVSTYGGGSQVQANWNESDSTADSYILNKPYMWAGGTDSLSKSAVKFGKSSNTASRNYAVCGGDDCTASGIASAAWGYNAKAQADYSIALGHHVTAYSNSETAIGHYNVSSKSNNQWWAGYNTSFSHGIGTNQYDMKNSIEIMGNGDLYAYGIGNYNGKNATADDSYTLAYVINNIQTNLGTAASVAAIIVGNNS